MFLVVEDRECVVVLRQDVPLECVTPKDRRVVTSGFVELVYVSVAAEQQVLEALRDFGANWVVLLCVATRPNGLGPCGSVGGVVDEERDSAERSPLVHVLAAKAYRHDVAGLDVANILPDLLECVLDGIVRALLDRPTTSMILVTLMGCLRCDAYASCPRLAIGQRSCSRRRSR